MAADAERMAGMAWTIVATGERRAVDAGGQRQPDIPYNLLAAAIAVVFVWILLPDHQRTLDSPSAFSAHSYLRTAIATVMDAHSYLAGNTTCSSDHSPRRCVWTTSQPNSGCVPAMAVPPC